MRDYRKKMRASGLRLVQFWLPDTHSAGFAEEATRQPLNTRQAQATEAIRLDSST